MRDEIAEDAVARVQAKMNSLFGDSPARSIEEIWRPGEEIDGYRIEREIGRGGFGQVYKAAEINGGRTVAIKVFHYSSMTKEHFQREYDALKVLSQVEGVVDLLRGNIDDSGNYFVVTEFIEGIPLNVMLEQEELPERETFDYLEQLVAIICRLHEWRDASHIRQFVHGDIKPNNIIVSDSHDNRGRRRITLIDFGIALRVPLEAINEEVNAISYVQPIGMTPGYCAPEVHIERRVTQAGDVFQAALVGYEMLTGERYWNLTAKDRYQTLRRRSRELAISKPQTLEAVRALLLGQSFKRLVLRQALAWNPEDRFQTAADFANALQHPWRWLFLRCRAVSIAWLSGLSTSLAAALIALIVVGVFLNDAKSQRDSALAAKAVVEGKHKEVEAEKQELEAEEKRLRNRIEDLEEQLVRARDWRGNATERYREIVRAVVEDYLREPTEAGMKDAERLIHDWLRDYENLIRADRGNDESQDDLDHVLRLQEWLKAVGRDGRRVTMTVTELIDNRRFSGGRVQLIVAVQWNDEYVAVSPVQVVERRNRIVLVNWSPGTFKWRLHDTLEISIWEGDRESRSLANEIRLTPQELIAEETVESQFPDDTYGGKFRLTTEPASGSDVDWAQPPRRLSR